MKSWAAQAIGLSVFEESVGRTSFKIGRPTSLLIDDLLIGQFFRSNTRSRQPESLNG
jgi:hypothetical protein